MGQHVGCVAREWEEAVLKNKLLQWKGKIQKALKYKYVTDDNRDLASDLSHLYKFIRIGTYS